MHEQLDLAGTVGPIVRQAGTILLSYFRTDLVRNEKENGMGFVTKADLSSEQYLISALKEIIPEADFYAEESGTTDNGNSYCWVIDPLDGTTNFAHGLPHFCVSVALTYKGKPIFGMIYQPLQDELFYAIAGKGAFCNGQSIKVSVPKGLKDCLIVTGVPYKKGRLYEQLLERAWTITQKSYAMRTFGAVALDLAYVASGRVDATFFGRLGWWDVAAGMLLVQEAGGQVSDFEGNEVIQGYQSCVAASRPIYQELVPLLEIKA